MATDTAGYEPIDGVKLLRTFALHTLHVRRNLLAVRQDLERRAEEHDASKLHDDEFDGFARINATAREFPYGSPEYRASLDAERPTINRHNARNSHHPEHHDQVTDMGWLDIIEMVCDWRAAWEAYGKQGTWRHGMQIQRGRFAFADEQWWLVEQVAAYLEEAD